MVNGDSSVDIQVTADEDETIFAWEASGHQYVAMREANKFFGYAIAGQTDKPLVSHELIEDLGDVVDGKANKVSNATNGNLAALDSNGNLTDSGISKNVVPSTATTSNKLATKADTTLIERLGRWIFAFELTEAQKEVFSEDRPGASDNNYALSISNNSLYVGSYNAASLNIS